MPGCRRDAGPLLSKQGVSSQFHQAAVTRQHREAVRSHVPRWPKKAVLMRQPPCVNTDCCHLLMEERAHFSYRTCDDRRVLNVHEGAGLNHSVAPGIAATVSYVVH